MKAVIVVLLLGMLCTLTQSRIIMTTCARMNTFLNKFAQASCIGSCKFQNCGTGHCEDRGRPVCVCSRCDIGGGSWPSLSLNLVSELNKRNQSEVGVTILSNNTSNEQLLSRLGNDSFPIIISS